MDQSSLRRSGRENACCTVSQGRRFDVESGSGYKFVQVGLTAGAQYTTRILQETPTPLINIP